MTLSKNLPSFGPEATALVIGSSGGIGAAFVDCLKNSPQFKTVLTASRKAPELSGCDFQLDITNEQMIEAVAKAIYQQGETLDLVIIASGILHASDGTPPEKTLRHLNFETTSDIFAVNCIGPALVMKHMSKLLSKNRKSVIASLSARVGSISDNRLGGWYSYRASKAALNMMIRSAAIELERRWPKAVCVGLHPGTVKTSLSSPFQAGVPAEKLFSPDYAANAMLSVLDGLNTCDSGGCFAYDGQKIEA